ncbi:P-loop containing nucleoside triphosphate hydrolase protein [Spinellus fusiger]|nr:P-loop containing nucleoside triphosphate hydrolase protein [Spinellus fusiger]
MHHRSLDVLIDQDIDFSTLVQNKHLLSGLEHSGYASPSPIQLQAIPLGRLGVDLVAQAKSGTGKTVVFGVISLEAIQVVERVPQALIVAPTREIAIQIRDVVRNLGKSMEGLQCEAVIGGLSTQGDEQKVKYSQIVVGTPGKLMALLDAKRINTHSIKLLVLDEADKLMSDTFRPQINYIFRKLPVTKQCVAFSATFTEELLSALGTMMNSPQIVRLTETVPTLQENEAMAALQVYEAKFEAAADVLGKIPFYQCMIFVNSVPRAIELSKWLTDMGWRSGHISSSLSQDQRLSVMENMRDFKLRILVCSDLIARGIDIDRVNLVINIDFPWEIETYLHRVGRTGRFGKFTFIVRMH